MPLREINCVLYSVNHAYMMYNKTVIHLLQSHGQSCSNGTNDCRGAPFLSCLLRFEVKMTCRSDLSEQYRTQSIALVWKWTTVSVHQLTKNTVPPPHWWGVEFLNKLFLATSTPGLSTPPTNLCIEKKMASLYAMWASFLNKSKTNNMRESVNWIWVPYCDRIHVNVEIRC